MKLAGIETFVVGNPPPRHGGRYFIFVKLTTDDGIDGIGEAYCRVVNKLESQEINEYTVEPLYNGHPWDPKFVRYNEVSLSQGLPVYFR